MKVYSYYTGEKYQKINRFRKEAILDFIKDEPNKNILDIGCSDGQMGEIIKKEFNSNVFGVELSSEMATAASKRLDKVYRFNIEDELMKWDDDLNGKTFDKIILSEVLEHLFSPESLLKKIKTFSHEKTEVIVTVPNVLFWKNRLKIFFGNFNYTNEGLMDIGHIHFFTWTSLQKTLSQAGYRVLDINNHIPTRGTKMLGKIFPGLFSFQFIVKIKKI